MTDQIDYSLSTVKQDRIKYCKNSNSLECKKYLNGLNDLLNDI